MARKYVKIEFSGQPGCGKSTLQRMVKQLLEKLNRDEQLAYAIKPSNLKNIEVIEDLTESHIIFVCLES